MNIRPPILLFAVLTVALTLRFLSPTWGCATARPQGAHISIASEEALIVWDPTTHTEQFIRRASFVGQAPQFGFLVPTPSPPKLAPTDDDVFQALGRTYHPRFVPRPEYGLKLISLAGVLFPTFSGAKGRASIIETTSAQRVSVLDSEQVAGYDAVVLRADDAAALTGWLNAHGYETRPAMQAWLRPYIDRHWSITAFKMAKPDTGQSTLSSGTVRMSFITDRPFFPYSEPADQRDANADITNQRLLRVYCVSTARMDGALDSAAVRWPGRARWADPISWTDRAQVVAAVSGFEMEDHLPSQLWLTTFEDKSSPRPGVADLYFTPAAQQVSLVPVVYWPEDRRFGIPIELLVVGVIVAVNKFRRRRQARYAGAIA